jgi:type I restriction enzyme S subunit
MADDGWQPRRFGDLATLSRNTVTPDAIDDCVYIGLEHIGEGTLSLLGTGTSSDVTSTKNRFRAGQILFGKLRPYFRKVVRPNFDGVCSTDIWVIDPTSDTDADFLFYLVASDSFVEPVVRASEGTKMPRAKWDYARDLIFDVPRHDEQRAIGAVLRAIDDKIGLNRRMAQTLEEMARALFKSWFVDFDPVRAKAQGRDPGLPKHLADLFPDRLVNSELGDIPEGWSARSLDEIARFLNGLAMQKFPPEVGVPTLPVIKIAQLRSGSTLGADLASSALKPDYIVKDGDILFSWSGTLECVYWSGGPGALNQHLFKVIPNGTPHSICYLAVHEFLEHFRGIAAGKATTMGHIQRRDLTAAKLAMPPSELLLAIGDVLDAILERSCSCQVEARSLARLRDSLLPGLVSGEVRLPDPEGLLARLEAVA